MASLRTRGVNSSCRQGVNLRCRLTAIFRVDNPDVLLNHLGQAPEAVDALQRLSELLPSDHPGRTLLARTFGEV